MNFKVLQFDGKGKVACIKYRSFTETEEVLPQEL
jgi:hypothetical protein